MGSVATFLSARRGRARLDLSDWLAYVYLVLGVVIMFGPVLWLASSSLKTQAALQEFPPSILPSGQKLVKVEGHEAPLPLFERLISASRMAACAVAPVAISTIDKPTREGPSGPPVIEARPLSA